MSFIDEAIKSDLKGDIREAIELYKKAIKNNEGGEIAYLNLIGILVQINFDYGFFLDLSNKKIIEENEIVAFDRLMDDLINEGIKKFGTTNEFTFWKYYVDNYYKEFSRAELVRIIGLNENEQVPYFHLFFNDVINSVPYKHYESRILTLEKKLRAEPTIKNKYILSLIESVKENNQIDFI